MHAVSSIPSPVPIALILTLQSVSACTRTHRARQTENGRIFAVFFIPVGITILLKQLAAIGDAVFQSRYQKVKATVVVVVVVVDDTGELLCQVS